MAVRRETPRCWDVSLKEETKLIEHRPFAITAACVLPNGVKVSAGSDGELNAFNPNNLAQFTTRVMLRPDGTERVTMLYAWDAWDEFMPVAPASGPRWFVALVITHDPLKWFQPGAKRHASRLCVWNVKTGQVAALMGTHQQAAHGAQVTHLAHYRNILISGCQDGSVLAWDPAFPIGPLVSLNDKRYDEGRAVNVLAGLHCVDDDNLNAGGAGGPVLVAMLYSGGVIVWNLWEMLRLARSARDMRAPPPLQPPIATGMMGVEGDRVVDTTLTRTDPLPPLEPHWRMLALVVPAGSANARIRHFTVQEFVIQRKFIEIPMNFLSSTRIVATEYAVAVIGAGLITVVQQAGYGDRGWDAADLLEAASKGGQALDYDDPLAVGDMGNPAPRVYRWFDERLTARTMSDDAAIVATTAADGASCIVFVRLLDSVLAFTTQLDGNGHKIDGKLLPTDIVSGKPTLLVAAGYGSDDEADILVGDSQGTAVVVDTRTLEEPTRLTHVSFFDILPSLLDFLFVTLQISAFSFLARNRVQWSKMADPIRTILRVTIADIDVNVRDEYPIQFLVMAVLGLFGIFAAFVYQRYEVLKPVPRVGAAQTNTRLDDGPCMRLLWWFAWFANCIAFVPIARTMIVPLDCDKHGAGHEWTLDPTSTPSYVGDTPCFRGVHWIWFWGGFLLMLPIGSVALRLSPLSGDVSHMIAWWDSSWLWRTGDRAFLGEFTRHNVTANVTSFATFIVKCAALACITIFGRWKVAVTVFLIVCSLLLVLVGIMFPTYESPTMNRALTGGHLLCVITSLCAFFTAVVDDPTVDWPAMVLVIVWCIAILAGMFTAGFALFQCVCMRPKPQRAQAKSAARMRRRGSNTYTGHLATHGSAQNLGQVSVNSAAHVYQYHPLLPFPQVKEWAAISPWDPAAWFRGAKAAHQAAFAAAQAAAHAAATGAGGGAGAGAGAAGGAAVAAAPAKQFDAGAWSAPPMHQDAEALAAEVRAQVAHHEAEKMSLKARLAAERRRQKAKALNRKKARSAKKRGVIPLAPQTSMERGAEHEPDAKAAMEYVYAEHDTAMTSLKARMEAERAEQKARLQARLKAREEGKTPRPAP